MQHPFRTIDDLLKDESFINYCLRNNDKDVQYWETFIKDNPGKKELLEEAVHEYRLLFTALANADLEEQLAHLKQKIEEGNPAPVYVLPPVVHVHTSLYKRLLQAAAAVLLLAIGLYLVKNYKKGAVPQPAAIAYACKQGERKSFQFPDGTQVVLNAGSEIVLNREYGKKTREVLLKGEAFFEVQHNKAIPFIVHTTSMDVKAVGTAFNVKSYHDDRKTETVLIRGLVEVTLKKDNNRLLLLHPNEKVSWTDDRGTTTSSNTPSTGNRTSEQLLIKTVKKLDDGNIKEVAWVQNNLAFDDEPFEEIAGQLNRWYNVHIQFASEDIKQYHFTATFKKEKIEQVFDILRASKKFSYRFADRQTIIIGH
jgi:ferric-dicitrate binding protein FerR (iron transport regulator)